MNHVRNCLQQVTDLEGYPRSSELASFNKLYDTSSYLCVSVLRRLRNAQLLKVVMNGELTS